MNIISKCLYIGGSTTLTLRHFRIFVTVSDTKNMTAAAKALFMSQPAVSQAISELEAYYQVRLFERLSRQLHLTEAGEKLLGYARHILRTTQDAETALRSLDENGTIRVGASVTIGTSVLPTLVVDFKSTNPQVKIEVVEDNTATIEKMVAKDVLDIGLVEGEITIPNLTIQPFAEDHLVLVCGANHKFAGRSAIEPSELESEDFILREAGSGTRNSFESVMTAHGLKWKASWTCNNVDTIKAAVAAGLGISLISQRSVSKEVEYGTLHIVGIKELIFKRHFKLIYHKNKHLTASMNNFIHACLLKSSEI